VGCGVVTGLEVQTSKMTKIPKCDAYGNDIETVTINGLEILPVMTWGRYVFHLQCSNEVCEHEAIRDLEPQKQEALR
jgi:hypothetical protein